MAVGIRAIALRAALWGWVVAVAVATLAPLPGDAYDLAAAPMTDKLVHFVLFGGLGVLSYLNAWPRAGWRWAVGLAVVAAALIEVAQLPLVYRSADVWDFAAGSAGAVVACAGALMVTGRKGW